MCRVVAWIVPRLILMILILMAICCAMILLALPPLWILMILVAICCAVFLLALPLRILMTHDASGYWNAGKWWSGYFHLLLKKESRNRESIILVRPRGFPRETRLMFIKTPGKMRGGITRKTRGFSCRRPSKDVRNGTVLNFLYAGYLSVRPSVFSPSSVLTHTIVGKHNIQGG